MNAFLRPLVLFVAVLGAGTAMAEKRSPPPDSALPDSVRRAEQRGGGEVIRAESMQRDGHDVMRYKVLTADGRVRVIQDDPHRDTRGTNRPDAQDRRPQRRQGSESREEPRNEDSRPF
jgi:hypothetical protein